MHTGYASLVLLPIKGHPQLSFGALCLAAKMYSLTRILSTLLLICHHLILTANGATKISNLAMYKYDRDAIQERPIERQIHPFILARRSMKHMNGKPVDHEELMSLFEAARWAPSAYNLQEWRFVYAERDGPYWDRFFDLLTKRNQQWAGDAGVLVVVLSSKYEKYRGHKLPVATHSFDAGAAWALMAIEGCARGLVVHATGGYDPQKVAEVIGLNGDDYQVEAILVIGNRALKGKPENTTQRFDVSKFVFDGIFEEKV